MKCSENMRILGALLRKEVTLMRRNPIIPKMILVMPLMVMLVLPLVATMDVRNVSVAVVDNDRTQLSRRLVADMDATAELTVTALCGTHSEAMARVEEGSADVVVTIPPEWSRNPGPLYVEANGVDATRGALGARYVAGSVAHTLRQWRAESGARMPSASVTVTDRYNPTLDFRNFMIPALLVILLILICGFLPALNLVQEKETGTMEAMNVAPVGRGVFVLSKLVPFWVTGLGVITVGMAVGGIVYGLWPLGSAGAIYLAAVLFSLFMSGLGVAVANRSHTMLQAIMVMFAFIVVFQLMGGLFTPIGSMPAWAQALTYVVPPRYFNEIMRGVYLRGASVADLWGQYLCLAAAACVACVAAALTYRRRG